MDAELARSLWNYDETTGELRWKVKPCQRVSVGDVAGCINKCGYLVVRCAYKLHLVHRIVWLITTGALPVNELDHVNGIRNDNRLSNLREVTRRQNQRNRKCHRTGHLLYTTYDKHKGRWKAVSPTINGKRKHIGHYDTMQEASVAAEKWLELNYPKGRN
jgi:hypothetical protein